MAKLVIDIDKEEEFLNLFSGKLSKDLDKLSVQVKIHLDITQYTDQVIEMFILKAKQRMEDVLVFFQDSPQDTQESFFQKMLLVVDFKTTQFKKEMLG